MKLKKIEKYENSPTRFANIDELITCSAVSCCEGNKLLRRSEYNNASHSCDACCRTLVKAAF